MTEGFRGPAAPTGRGRWADTAASREQEVTDTVQRIIGDDIAPPTIGPASAGRSGEASTSQVAKEQAAEVADTAKQAGAQVVDTVTEQAGQVTDEATAQAKRLLSQVQSELTEQAAGTQHRIADGLHALADELTGMARNTEQDGVATDLVRQAADRARTAAGWLADRDPGSLLDEVRSFARTKPGTYLALALGAGVVAGRLARGLTAPAGNTPEARPTASTTRMSAGEVGRPASHDSDLGAAPVYDSLPATGLGTNRAVGARGDVAP